MRWDSAKSSCSRGGQLCYTNCQSIVSDFQVKETTHFQTRTIATADARSTRLEHHVLTVNQATPRSAILLRVLGKTCTESDHCILDSANIKKRRNRLRMRARSSQILLLSTIFHSFIFTSAMSPASSSSTGIAARLARQNILDLSPYRCARDDYNTGVLLDANENAFGSSTSAADESIVLERYPDPYQIPLKKKFAAHRGYGLVPANIFVGVGSDEAIDLLMRIFCRPGQDQILTTPPTYGMYKVSAKVNDLAIVNVPLTVDFDLRIPQVSGNMQDENRMDFVLQR